MRISSDSEPSIPFVAADVSLRGGVHDIGWDGGGRAGAVAVFAGTDPAAIGRDLEVGGGRDVGTVRVPASTLPGSPRWCFELVPDSGESLVVADRRLHLTAAPNLRDLGGYRTVEGRWVRPGMLFRSGELSTLTREDVVVLEAVGIARVIDLRTAAERASAPDVVLAGTETTVLDVLGGAPARWLDVSWVTDLVMCGDPARQQEELGHGRAAALMAEASRSFVTTDTAACAFGAMLADLCASDGRPTLFHCTAGKDRTGWAAAVILSVLGVPRESVVEDYLASNELTRDQFDDRMALTAALIDPALFGPLQIVAKEYLDVSFDTIEAEFGSIEGYLVDGLGLPVATIDDLRAAYLVG